MPLFTFVLEFAGGTYISQLRAHSVARAVTLYTSELVRNKAVSTLSVRKRLADALSAERPLAVDSVRNVWCCSTSVGGKFALLNVVATMERPASHHGTDLPEAKNSEVLLPALLPKKSAGAKQISRVNRTMSQSISCRCIVGLF